MFSQNFYAADIYSLLTFDKVSTIAAMPWRFTGLSDEAYQPSFTDDVRYKLNSYFRFEVPLRGPSEVNPLRDDEKDLYIEYNDDGVVGYYTKTMLAYSTLQHPYCWDAYVNSTGLHEMNEIKKKIDLMTDATDIGNTYIAGVEYNADASFKSVRVYDNTYNLADFPQTDILTRLQRVPNENPFVCQGLIELLPDTDTFHYNIFMQHTKHLNQNYKGAAGLCREVPRSRATAAKLSLDKCLEYGILTQEQSDFIRDKIVGDCFFRLEYRITDGEIEDAWVNLIHTFDFEDLTTL